MYNIVQDWAVRYAVTLWHAFVTMATSLNLLSAYQWRSGLFALHSTVRSSTI